MGKISRRLSTIYIYCHGGYKLPFFKRKPYRLTFLPKRNGEEFIRETNIKDDDMTIICLSKAGYGSLSEIRKLDTPEFLDLVEYENISRDIEQHIIDRTK